MLISRTNYENCKHRFTLNWKVNQVSLSCIENLLKLNYMYVFIEKPGPNIYFGDVKPTETYKRVG